MKKVFLLLLAITIVFFAPFSHPDTKAADETVVFEDGFESGLGQWRQKVDSPNKVYTTTNPIYSGTHSLILDYIEGTGPENNYIEVSHEVTAVSNVLLRGWLYDDLDSSLGIFFGIKEGDNNTGIGIHSEMFPDTYYFRANDPQHMYNTYVPRSRGWHLFELIVLNSGVYGKIDGYLLTNPPSHQNPRIDGPISFFVNQNQTKVDQISIVSTWGLTGKSYYDEIKLIKAPSSIEEIKFGVNNIFLSIYGNTDFSPLYPDLGRTIVSEGRYHGNDVRSILAIVEALALDYKLTQNQERLTRAKALLQDVLDYTHWEEIDSVSVAVPSYWLYSASQLLWPYLETATKEKITQIIILEANRIVVQTPGSGYINDSKAEENAWNAALLAAAANFLPAQPDASLWEEKARCFAYHSITTSSDPAYCGIKTQTVYDDFSLDNHDQHPSPSYTMSALDLISEGALSYKLAGKPVPNEFKHNFKNLWQKYKTYLEPNIFQYTLNNDWGSWGFFWYSPLILSFLEDQFPQLNHGINHAELFQAKFLFNYQTVSYFVPQPVVRMDNFNQIDHSTLSYKWLINSAVNHAYVMDYLYRFQRTISLSPGWNEITWPDVSGKKAADIPSECSIAVAKESFWFKPYVKDFGGVNFNFEKGKIYYLKCTQAVTWEL